MPFFSRRLKGGQPPFKRLECRRVLHFKIERGGDMFIGGKKMVLFLFLHVLFMNTYGDDLKQSKYSLIAHEYELSEYDKPMIRFYLEYQEFKKRHPMENFVLIQKASITIEGVMYFFFFSSMNDPNITVVAHINCDNTNKKEYYKINKNNEPPNLWISMAEFFLKCENRRA
jgi:hypothetical protein